MSAAELNLSTGSLFETAEDRAVARAYEMLRGDDVRLSARQIALLRIIADRRGAARAVSVADLARQFNTTPREIKGDVRDLRMDFGLRIGSSRDQEAGGYYLITSKAELLATVTPMLHQLRSEAALIRAMCEPHELAELEGQLRLSESTQPQEAA